MNLNYFKHNLNSQDRPREKKGDKEKISLDFEGKERKIDQEKSTFWSLIRDYYVI